MNDSQIHHYTLKNGLKIAFCYKPNLKNTYFNFTVGAGSIYDPEQKVGLAHFVEHLISPCSDRTKIENTGGTTSAYTQFNTCKYTAFAPSGNEKVVLDYYCKTLFNREFSVSDFSSELKMIRQEQSHHPTPSTYESLLLKMFPEKKGLGIPRDGTAESLLNISQNDTLEFYKKYYQPGNIALSIVGNFDIQQLSQMTEDTLGVFTSQKFDTNNVDLAFFKGPQIFFTPNTNHTGSLSLIFAHKVGFTHTDRFKLRLVAEILTGRTNSLLSKYFRFTQKTSYTIDTTNYLSINKGFFYTYLDVEKEEIKDALTYVSEAIEKLADSGPTNEQLAGIKMVDIAEWNRLYESPESLSDYLALETLLGSYKPINEIASLVNTYTTVDLANAVKDHLSEENLGIQIKSMESSKEEFQINLKAESGYLF